VTATFPSDLRSSGGAPSGGAPSSGTARAAARRRPRVGVVKFASCDGCQLTVLDLEDELLEL